MLNAAAAWHAVLQGLVLLVTQHPGCCFTYTSHDSSHKCRLVMQGGVLLQNGQVALPQSCKSWLHHLPGDCQGCPNQPLHLSQPCLLVSLLLCKAFLCVCEIQFSEPESVTSLYTYT